MNARSIRTGLAAFVLALLFAPARAGLQELGSITFPTSGAAGRAGGRFSRA